MSVFNDNSPVFIKKRSGTSDEPFQHIRENITIVNNHAILTEIPHKTNKVSIDGFIEINTEFDGLPALLKENEFYVDYRYGHVIFNILEDKKVIDVEYLGTGVVYYSDKRIVLHERGGNPSETLYEFIDKADGKLVDIDKVASDAINATKECENIIDKAKTSIVDTINATNECKSVTNTAKDIVQQGLNELEKIKEAKVIVDNALNNSNEALEKATESKEKIEELNTTNNQVIKDINEEKENWKIDRLNARLIWKEPVVSFAELDLTYQNPEKGYVVTTLEDGKIYRYNGLHWILIHNPIMSIPATTHTKNGLMSKEDKVKLDDIEPSAERNLKGEAAKDVLPNEFRTKTIVFVMPLSVFKTGIQNIRIPFPYKGKIKRITGICTEYGLSDTYIQIQKIPKNNLQNDTWMNVFNDGFELRFKSNEYLSTDGSFLNVEINKDDLFRLNIKKVAGDIKNITINIEILT